MKNKEKIYVTHFKNNENICPAMSDVMSVAKENGILLSRNTIRRGNQKGAEFMQTGKSRFEASIYIVEKILPIDNSGKKLLSTGLSARRAAYMSLGDPFGK